VCNFEVWSVGFDSFLGLCDIFLIGFENALCLKSGYDKFGIILDDVKQSEDQNLSGLFTINLSDFRRFNEMTGLNSSKSIKSKS
jgi:hypothetical protein